MIELRAKAILDGLEWSKESTAHAALSRHLEEDVFVNALLGRLASLPDDEVAAVAQRSHETGTHYKWFVGADDLWRWQVWVHEFKPTTRMRQGYGVTPHDHRYWFTSRIISGGFDHHRYVADPDPVATAKNAYRAGAIYTVSPDDIHSLSNIADETVTLLIRGRGTRQFSTEYLPNGQRVQHTTLRDRLCRFRGQLRRASPP